MMDSARLSKDEDIIGNESADAFAPKPNSITHYFYFKIFRKLVIIFYLILNIVYHGLQIEFYKNAYSWQAARIIEIILLILIVLDMIIMQLKLLKFQGKILNLVMVCAFGLVSVQIGLKIWGPDYQNKSAIQAVNIIRIFISLYALFALDENEFVRLKSLYQKSKRNKSILHSDKQLEIVNPIDKNQNPDYNGIINPKSLNVIRAHSHSKLNSIRVDVKNSDLNELKILEEMMNVVRLKVNKSSSDANEVKLNLNRPFAKTLSDQLNLLLSDNFNIFVMDTDSFQNSLFVLANYYYNFYKWENLKITEIKFMNLIYNVQKNYNGNSYHNMIHAADVTNTCFVILEKMEVRVSSKFSDLETLILLLSCATHDIDHPGNTNAYEINTRSLLALTYNDKSVLENYHLFLFFNFLINDNMNIFSQFDLNEIKNIRKLFITNIIATDMMNHAGDLKRLKEAVNTPDFDKTKQENKELIMTQLIHFADISNGTKQIEIYDKWVNKLFVEFFTQGEKEKELGLPVSFLCDREKTAVPESQIFFINFFTLDLTKTLVIIYSKFEALYQALETNKKIWEGRKGKPYEIRNLD